MLSRHTSRSVSERYYSYNSWRGQTDLLVVLVVVVGVVVDVDVVVGVVVVDVAKSKSAEP